VEIAVPNACGVYAEIGATLGQPKHILQSRMSMLRRELRQLDQEAP
jgi:hypothetical protein